MTRKLTHQQHMRILTELTVGKSVLDARRRLQAAVKSVERGSRTEQFVVTTKLGRELTVEVQTNVVGGTELPAEYRVFDGSGERTTNDRLRDLAIRAVEAIQ